jgi:MFS family permease
MGVPPELVQRSAAARAEADGTSMEDVLAAWAGDAPPPAPSTAPEPEPEAEAHPEAEPETQQEAEPAPSPVAVLEEPDVPAEPAAAVAEPEPEEELEPVPISTRIKTAVRIGAWTGAGLGVVGFLVASAFWAPDTTTLEATGPVVQVSPNSLIIGAALISIVFGAVVAGMSRSATSWTNPAMELSSSKGGTAWLGAALGLILGFIAGAVLQGFGTAVEGSDPPLVQLPVLATLIVMVVGGAILGAATAMIPQVLGVPVAVDEADTEEVETVKGRLGNALSIPLAGLLILVLLVLPFGFTLIESNHVAPGVGGAVVAIVTAGGILGFAALAGSRPEMRISFGDLMVAVIGIGVVLIIIISVLFAIQDEEHTEDEPAEEAAIVLLV